MVVLILMALVLGLVIAVTEWWDSRAARQDEQLRRSGIRVRGRVTSIDEINGGRGILGWDVGAEFEYQGQHYLTASRRQRSKPGVKVGDSVNVYLMPDDPKTNRILDIDIMTTMKGRLQ